MVMASCSQCLGIVFLCIQVLSTKAATGISAKSIVLDGLSIVCRLSCTLWLNAYIPDDPTGDALYQSIEILSLVLIVWLLHMVTVTHKSTYQAAEDTANVSPVVVSSLMLAVVLHANLADRPVFDVLWMTGLFAGVVAVVPQLLLITKTGGRVQALTSHYVVALALSRLLSGILMWIARDYLTSDPWIEGVNHGKWTILVAHAMQIILVADFGYHYVKSAIQHGFRGTLELPTSMFSGDQDWSKARWV